MSVARQAVADELHAPGPDGKLCLQHDGRRAIFYRAVYDGLRTDGNLSFSESRDLSVQPIFRLSLKAIFKRPVICVQRESLGQMFSLLEGNAP